MPVCSALALVGFGKKGSSASSCADAINKGVDTMMAAGAKRMEGARADEQSNKQLDALVPRLRA